MAVQAVLGCGLQLTLHCSACPMCKLRVNPQLKIKSRTCRFQLVIPVFSLLACVYSVSSCNATRNCDMDSMHMLGRHRHMRSHSYLSLTTDHFLSRCYRHTDFRVNIHKQAAEWRHSDYAGLHAGLLRSWRADRPAHAYAGGKHTRKSRPSKTQACLRCGYVHKLWERKRRLGRAETRDHKHSVQKERQSKGKAYE